VRLRLIFESASPEVFGTSAIGADSRKRKSIAQMRRDGFIAVQHGMRDTAGGRNALSGKARPVRQS
jgi:hypothetical protein